VALNRQTSATAFRSSCLLSLLHASGNRQRRSSRTEELLRVHFLLLLIITLVSLSLSLSLSRTFAGASLLSSGALARAQLFRVSASPTTFSLPGQKLRVQESSCIRRAAPDQPQTYYARASHYYTDTCGVKAGHADSGRGRAQVDLDRGRAESLSVKCQVQFARTRHAVGRIKDDPGATARPVPTPPCAISGGESSASPFALSPFRSHEKSKALSSSNCWGRGKRVFASDGVRDPEQLIVAIKSQRRGCESVDHGNAAPRSLACNRESILRLVAISCSRLGFSRSNIRCSDMAGARCACKGIQSEVQSVDDRCVAIIDHATITFVNYTSDASSSLVLVASRTFARLTRKA